MDRPPTVTPLKPEYAIESKHQRTAIENVVGSLAEWRDANGAPAEAIFYVIFSENGGWSSGGFSPRQHSTRMATAGALLQRNAVREICGD